MDELKHYGIKGQKWGVRRYENEDGTLTPEGKERYYGISKIKNSLSLKLQDPKIKKAMKIGAAIAGTALAVYGGYKVSQYLTDQKTIMALNDNMSIIKGLIPQYKGNISAMNKGLAPSIHLQEYTTGLRTNKSNLNKMQAMKNDISAKHLVNIGKNMSLSQYNKTVSDVARTGSAIAKGTGKAAAAVGKTVLQVGKDTAQFLVDNSESVAEILAAIYSN